MGPVFCSISPPFRSLCCVLDSLIQVSPRRNPSDPEAHDVYLPFTGDVSFDHFVKSMCGYYFFKFLAAAKWRFSNSQYF